MSDTPNENNQDFEELNQDQTEAAGPDPISGGDPVLAELKAERDSLFQRLARATADFRNAQNRLEKDKEQAVQYANSSLIKTLLPVIDNFERALSVDVGKVDAATILKGLQIVHDQLLTVLKTQSVEQITPQPGDVFDPKLHEALMQQDSAEYGPGHVTMLMQRGYSLHGRTLRPAGVAVSRLA